MVPLILMSPGLAAAVPSSFHAPPVGMVLGGPTKRKATGGALKNVDPRAAAVEGVRAIKVVCPVGVAELKPRSFGRRQGPASGERDGARTMDVDVHHCTGVRLRNIA